MKTSIWLLAGILVVLLGILWVAVDYTGILGGEAISEKETLCLENGGQIAPSNDGGSVCDILPFAQPGEKFGPEDWSVDAFGIDRFTEKELFCIRSQDGRIAWNTKGNKICDVSPYAEESNNQFDFDTDWIIE